METFLIADNPTYEELEQRVKELEKENIEFKRVEDALKNRIVSLTLPLKDAMREYKELCLEAGMDDFLSKPFTREGLLSMVSKWLKVGKKSVIRTVTTSNPNPEIGQDILPIEATLRIQSILNRLLMNFRGISNYCLKF